MKTKYIGAVAMLALFGLVEPSIAHYGPLEHPDHPRDGLAGPLRYLERYPALHHPA